MERKRAAALGGGSAGLEAAPAAAGPGARAAWQAEARSANGRERSERNAAQRTETNSQECFLGLRSARVPRVRSGRSPRSRDIELRDAGRACRCASMLARNTRLEACWRPAAQALLGPPA